MARSVRDLLKDRMVNGVFQANKRSAELLNLSTELKKGGSDKWNAIRKIYQVVDLSYYRPYPIDWIPVFTPIEEYLWDEIRCKSLPFWPQYPIGKYFADFADPIKKFVIECDGAAYHNAIKDSVRDKYMTENGWCVFRISGSDCVRRLDSPWSKIQEYELDEGSQFATDLIKEWAFKTAEGFAASLKIVEYLGEREVRHELLDIALDVLDSRRATGY